MVVSSPIAAALPRKLRRDTDMTFLHSDFFDPGMPAVGTVPLLYSSLTRPSLILIHKAEIIPERTTRPISDGAWRFEPAFLLPLFFGCAQQRDRINAPVGGDVWNGAARAAACG